MLSFSCVRFLLLSYLTFVLAFATTFATTYRVADDASIYDVLRDHGLPMGLFPKGVKEFDIAEDGRFWVHLDQACNAKFESELHYDRNVSGSLSYGQIEALSGVEAQDLFLWFPVMSIRVDIPSSGLIYFDVGAVYKQFSLSLFETPPDCVAVQSQEADIGSKVKDVYKGRSGRLRYQLYQGSSGRDVQ